MAKPLKLKVRLDLCARVRATAVQTTLDAAERRKNLKDAFAVKADVQGLHLALLDDVITTGATLEELSAALRDAGARRITVLSVCHAMNPRA